MRGARDRTRSKAVFATQLQNPALIVPSDCLFVTDSAYYLVYPPEFRDSAPLSSFRNWITHAARTFRAESVQGNEHVVASIQREPL